MAQGWPASLMWHRARSTAGTSISHTALAAAGWTSFINQHTNKDAALARCARTWPLVRKKRRRASTPKVLMHGVSCAWSALATTTPVCLAEAAIARMLARKARHQSKPSLDAAPASGIRRVLIHFVMLWLGGNTFNASKMSGKHHHTTPSPWSHAQMVKPICSPSSEYHSARTK